MPAITTAPAWVEVSLKALRSNFKALERLARGSRMLPLVKADAYGHGLVPCSKALVAAGAKALAVASVREGMALRKAGFRVPILVLTPTLPSEIPALLKNRLTPQVSSARDAFNLSRAAKRLRVGPVGVHVKVDSGMGRMGVQIRHALKEIRAIQRTPGIRVEAVYTHLATADWTDPKYAWKQIASFRLLLVKLQALFGRELPSHTANSAALIAYFPESQGDWVRPGIALYGVYPHPHMKKRVRLTPVMQAKTRVLHTKTSEKGDSVSYGRTYTAGKRTRIATLGMGYAEGVPRHLSNRGSFLVWGRRVPIVGRVCMNWTMVDVSKVPGVKVGDPAVFFGRQGKAFLPVEDQADKAGTISYELLCTVGKGLPRVYT